MTNETVTIPARGGKAVSIRHCGRQDQFLVVFEQSDYFTDGTSTCEACCSPFR